MIYMIKAGIMLVVFEKYWTSSALVINVGN